jgi:hypothetical protein
MLKIQITAINPSVVPRPHGGTGSLIPDDLAFEGDRPVQVTITVNSTQPYKSGKAIYEGADKALISNWLPDQHGMYGKTIGDDVSPANIVAVLTSATWLDWEIISGQEILDLPAPPNRPGAKY